MTARPDPRMGAPPAASPWFVPLGPADGAPLLHLYVFPYAGGGPSAYKAWPALLPDWTEVIGVQPPGRERRLLEEPYRRVEGLAPVLTAEVHRHARLPFAFFGHSMGALLAFEVARCLRDQHLPGPRHLFVSGFPAPQDSDTSVRTFNLDDDAFVAELQGLAGTPEEILDDPELMELMLPAIRADFELVETYAHRPGTVLDCPVTTLAGDADPVVDPASQAGWRDATTGSVRGVVIPGGHFFVHDEQAVVDAILPDLQARNPS